MRNYLTVIVLLLACAAAAPAATIEGSGILQGWSIIVDEPDTNREDVFCTNPYADQRTHTLICEADDAAGSATLSGRGRLLGWKVVAGEEICRNPLVEGYRIKCEYVDYRRPR